MNQHRFINRDRLYPEQVAVAQAVRIDYEVIDDMDLDGIVCLGDVVGYGYNSALERHAFLDEFPYESSGGSITGGDDFSVRAEAYLYFNEGGTYSISAGSASVTTTL